MTAAPTLPMPLVELALQVRREPAPQVGAGMSGAIPAADESGFSVEVVDASSAPGLTVRLQPEPGAPADPLVGHELWHPITDTVVLAGLRESGSAARLLRLLPAGALNRILMRMATPSAGSTGARATLGTVSALSTLACWPRHCRDELVEQVTEAVALALHDLPAERRGGSAMALGWVQSLAQAYPHDPMVLAPLLLQLRLIRAGYPYVVPPGWPSAHLHGVAVRVVAADAPVVQGGLGAADVDHDGFLAALTSGHALAVVEPSPEALDHAAHLARRLAAGRPPNPTFPS